jgi:hypothetical protein
MSGERVYEEAPLYSLLRYWLLATTMGFLLGGVVAMSVELASYDLKARFGVVYGDWTLAGGLVLGSTVTVLLQGLVLRRHALWSFRWITFSGAGLAVGVVLSTLTGTLEDILEHGGGRLLLLPALPSWWATMSLLLGTSLSVAQWLALRGRVARAWLWALVSGGAWLVSVPVGWLGGVFIGIPLGMLFGAVGGNVGGIVGGLVMPLVWVLITGGLVGSATGLLLMALLRGRPERPLRVR